MAESTPDSAQTVIQGLARHVNCLVDENRSTRKRAIEGIRKETTLKKPQLEPEVLQEVLIEVIKPILKTLFDPVEKCRELGVAFLTEGIKQSPDSKEFLHNIIPVFVQRLGQQEIVETSEEIRLSMVELLITLIELNQKVVAIYLDDFVKILQRTIVDPYPETKKASCTCSSVLAKTIPEQFHMQSESLIQPLLQTLLHQHSRTRVAALQAIGDVIQNGNNRSVDDVVSHLAQRLFDQSPAVRTHVIRVVGNWLLDLLDRYSFHHKLIPLLLTGITDEIPEIQAEADALWHDIGLKYEGENENDLKDKQDFMKAEPEHYPKGIQRPNLGCRTLVYRHFSKIVGGLLRDLGDWVDETRVKSAKLLYVLLLNEEDNSTQHLEKILSGLYKACGDEEKEVIDYVNKSAEILGYFVSPEVWVKLVLQSVTSLQSYNTLMILSSIIKGSQRKQLEAYGQDVASVLCNSAIRTSSDPAIQFHLLNCVSAVISIMKESCQSVSYDLFVVLISVIALHRSEDIKNKANTLLCELATNCHYSDKQELFSQHSVKLVCSMKKDFASWTQYSVDRSVFEALLTESGPVVGELLDEVIPMFVANLKPEKDPEVKLKIFTLLSRLMLSAENTVNSKQKFGAFVLVVVRDMIIPNFVWRAGRVAGVIRLTAVSCLWALLQSGLLTKENLSEVQEDLLKQLYSVLEDDNKHTRLTACRILSKIFVLAGSSLDQDRLHNIYPDLLKRLDDSSDDVRVAVAFTFQTYFDCFENNYQVDLYKAHLEALYKGLLVHMDDPEAKIQEAVLECLKKAASLCPSLLLDEINAVRLKHRSTKFLDELASYTVNVPKDKS